MSEDCGVKRVIIFDSDDSSQQVEIVHNKAESTVQIILDDGTYADLWTDQLVAALKAVGVVGKGKQK